MATGLVGFVGPIVSSIAGIGQFLMAPVGRHFGYLFSYKSKVKNLREEVEKLDEKRGAMQLSVDEAERNVKVIGPDVKGWLGRVDKCSEEAREILKDEVEANKGCLYGWRPNLKLRYSLGKKATNKAKEVAKLHEERKLTEVAYNEPPPGIESTSTEGIKVFESRRLITKDVMEALKDDTFHMIAICGMGGVGKTTMVKDVALVPFKAFGNVFGNLWCVCWKSHIGWETHLDVVKTFIYLVEVPHRLGDTFGDGQTPIYRCKGIGLAYQLLWFFLGLISHYEPSLSINFSCAELDFGHSSIGILAIVPPPKLC